MIRELAFDGTWAGWRAAARAALASELAPGAVFWRATSDAQLPLGGLLESTGDVAEDAPATLRVPRPFVEVAERAAHCRDRARWDVLYRVLWRLTHGERHLLDVEVDPDVRRLVDMDKAVRREVHKLHAFVRFRRVAVEGAEHFVAWIEPVHPVLTLAAPFFARRFASMRWAILTPSAAAYWDGLRLAFGPGVSRRDAPSGDPLEELWRTYYAHIFNPARVRPTAMRGEMPKRYWSALPEAALIPDLLGDAARRTREMIRRGT